MTRQIYFRLPLHLEILTKVFAAAVILLLITFQNANAQDSVVVERDTVLVGGGPDTVAIQSYAKRFSPRKAILYAAILPGLGQVYNKKYWKLPLVYGGFYFIGYYINAYNDIYTKYKGHLFDNLEQGLINPNDENKEVGLTTGQLRNIVDKARRERDLMVILMGGMYLLQMVDAHVDSHLKEFDLNPNLQVSIKPTMQQDVMTGTLTGMTVVFRF